MSTQENSLPSRIDRFRIVRPLGSGSFGHVYLATDPKRKNAQVAIKVPEGHGLSKDGLSRFQREGDAAKMMQHPNLCKVYETGNHNGLPFIVMEYVDGQTLESLLLLRKHKRQGPLDFLEATAWMYSLAQGMQHAHDKKVIHRDLKPGNIIIHRITRQMVIVDFGLARINDDVKQSVMGRPIGTVLYMPPEQANGDIIKMGPRSDIYSLGAIYYEMLCGETLFKGEAQLKIISEILTKPFEPPSTRFAGVPAGADDICRRAMMREPRDRYRDCQEFAEELRQIYHLYSTEQLEAQEIINLQESAEHLLKKEESASTHVPTGNGPSARNTPRKSSSLVGYHAAAETRAPLVDDIKPAAPQPPPTVGPDQPLPVLLSPPTKGGAETSRNGPANTVDDNGPFANPKVARKVNLAEIRRFVLGIGLLIVLFMAVGIVPISLGIVDRPEWVPESLVFATSQGPPSQDQQVAPVLLNEYNAVLEVLPVGESRTVVVTQPHGLPAQFYIKRIKFRDPNNVTSEGLARRLKDLPFLEKLELSSCQQLTNLDFLLGVPSLQHLDLSRRAYPQATTESDKKSAIKVLSQMKQLKSLDLSESQFPPELLSELSQIKIEALNLSSTKRETLGPKEFIALGQLPQLKELNLAHVELTDTDIEKLLKSKSLRSLDLSHTSAGFTTCSKLAEKKNWEVLNLSDCPAMTDDAVNKLCDLPRLKQLQLNGLNLTPQCLPNLSKLAALKSLELSRCRQIFGANGPLRDLTKQLVLPNLKSLMIDQTTMNEELLSGSAINIVNLEQLGLAETAIRSLSRKGTGLPALDSLRLSAGLITEDWINSIKPLEFGQKLRLLEVIGPDDSFDDKRLEKLLTKLENLKELSIRQCANVSLGDRSTLQTLQNSKNLRRLILYKTRVDTEIAKQIEWYHPKCEVIWSNLAEPRP